MDPFLAFTIYGFGSNGGLSVVFPWWSSTWSPSLECLLLHVSYSYDKFYPSVCLPHLVV